MTENHQEQLNQNERISVIVPVYNVEDYLQDCIDSITAQTYKNLEILLIDDGSTDRSGQMCDEIAKTDPRIKVIHQNNGGLSAARNTGIEHATADYYIFVDSDDSVEPTYAEDLYTNLITAGADISICGLAWLTEGDVFQQVDTVEVHVIDGREALQKVNDPYFVVQWNKCFKKEIFESLRYPVGRIHEDEFVAAQQLYQAKKVVYTNKRLYRYNASRQDSITNSFSIKRVYDRTLAFYTRMEFCDTIETDPMTRYLMSFKLADMMIRYFMNEKGMNEQEYRQGQELQRKFRKEHPLFYREVSWKKRLILQMYTGLPAFRHLYTKLLRKSGRFE